MWEKQKGVTCDFRKSNSCMEFCDFFQFLFLTLSLFRFFVLLKAKSDSELDVLSILPNSWQPDEPLQTKPYLLVPSTHVTFLAHRYRFVIELDLSPSTGIVVSMLISPSCSFSFSTLFLWLRVLPVQNSQKYIPYEEKPAYYCLFFKSSLHLWICLICISSLVKIIMSSKYLKCKILMTYF